MTRHVTCDGTFSRAFLARRQCTTSRGANMTRAPRRNSAPKKRCNAPKKQCSAPKKRCAVCDMEKSEYRKFRSTWVDKPMKLALRPDPSHFRYSTISQRQREGAFQRVVTAADVICRDCHNHHSSNAGEARRTRSERVAEKAVWDAIRIALLLEFIDTNCDGHFPKWCVTYALPGWNGPREEAALIPARRWIRDLIRERRRPGSPSRLVAVAALGHDEAALVADLLAREKPDDGYCDAKGYSRRVRILTKYVLEECGGELPRVKDRANLAGWKRAGAGVAQVPVGQWWYDFSIQHGGARKKRVEEWAPDEATQQALQYLAQCAKRDKDTRCDVKGDSRRVVLFATYVRVEFDGELPPKGQVAALAGWKREDAVVAQVQVGQWWYDFSRRNGGERKQRVAESAPDEETKKALQYLAQCKVRDRKGFKGQRN